jgi:hypothetical protein
MEKLNRLIEQYERCEKELWDVVNGCAKEGGNISDQPSYTVWSQCFGVLKDLREIRKELVEIPEEMIPADAKIA